MSVNLPVLMFTAALAVITGGRLRIERRRAPLELQVEVPAAGANRNFMDVAGSRRIGDQANLGRIEAEAGDGYCRRDVGVLWIVGCGLPGRAVKKYRRRG